MTLKNCTYISVHLQRSSNFPPDPKKLPPDKNALIIVSSNDNFPHILSKSPQLLLQHNIFTFNNKPLYDHDDMGDVIAHIQLHSLCMTSRTLDTARLYPIWKCTEAKGCGEIGNMGIVH